MSATRKWLGPSLLIGGGATILGAIFYGTKSAVVTNQIDDAVSLPPVPLPPSPNVRMPTMQARLTGYWPYAATAGERKMEGGIKDRKSRPIITLEMHQSDPVKYPYVSVAGDYTGWPDGQRVIIPVWPDAIFRVVDTGGHFFGVNKVYRLFGAEPLDIAVASSKTPVPKTAQTIMIVPGDNFVGGRAVSTRSFKGQTVSLAGGLRRNNA